MNLQITMTFTGEDLAQIKQSGVTVPMFWPTPALLPNAMDMVRFGGRQYVIAYRVWETSEAGTVLRLYMESSTTQIDASFH
jgi:hypothetical protein